MYIETMNLFLNHFVRKKNHLKLSLRNTTVKTVTASTNLSSEHTVSSLSIIKGQFWCDITVKLLLPTQMRSISQRQQLLISIVASGFWLVWD